jgi:hypothetical protein
MEVRNETTPLPAESLLWRAPSEGRRRALAEAQAVRLRAQLTFEINDRVVE